MGTDEILAELGKLFKAEQAKTNKRPVPTSYEYEVTDEAEEEEESQSEENIDIRSVSKKALAAFSTIVVIGASITYLILVRDY